MSKQLHLAVLFGLSALGFAGCSGGGSADSSSSVKVRCLDGSSFCLISCDLGCGGTGCAVTEIAENQPIRFTFSDNLDPSSVNAATFSIRTATGVAPAGEIVVNGPELTFVPSVSTVN
ncbi:MAG: hypothetical protein RL398_1683, partial [Planctomycetota bacterium]